jgi:hypothetical protein
MLQRILLTITTTILTKHLTSIVLWSALFVTLVMPAYAEDRQGGSKYNPSNGA